MNTYDQGDVVRCSVAFTDGAGAAVDPTTVRFRLSGPNTTLNYLYGTDVALVKDSVGNYHVDVSVSSSGSTSAGTYSYRFESTGNYQAAVEGTFTVSNSGIYG